MALNSLLLARSGHVMQTAAGVYPIATATTPFAVTFWMYCQSATAFQRVVSNEVDTSTKRGWILYFDNSSPPKLSLVYRSPSGTTSSTNGGFGPRIDTYPDGSTSVPTGLWLSVYFAMNPGGNFTLGCASATANNRANDVTEAVPADGIRINNSGGGDPLHWTISNTLAALGPAAITNYALFNVGSLTNTERDFIRDPTKGYADYAAHGTLGAKLVEFPDFTDPANMGKGKKSVFDFVTVDVALRGNGPDISDAPNQVRGFPTVASMPGGVMVAALPFAGAGDGSAPPYRIIGPTAKDLFIEVLKSDGSAIGGSPLDLPYPIPPNEVSSANDASTRQVSTGKLIDVSSAYGRPSLSGSGQHYGCDFFRAFISSGTNVLSQKGTLYATTASGPSVTVPTNTIGIPSGTYTSIQAFHDSLVTLAGFGLSFPNFKTWNSDGVAGYFIGAPDFIQDVGDLDNGDCIFYTFPNRLELTSAFLWLCRWSYNRTNDAVTFSNVRLVVGSQINRAAANATGGQSATYDGCPMSHQDASLGRISSSDGGGTAKVYIICKDWRVLDVNGAEATGQSIYFANGTDFTNKTFDRKVTNTGLNGREGPFLYRDAAGIQWWTNALSGAYQYQQGDSFDPETCTFAALTSPGRWRDYAHFTPTPVLLDFPETITGVSVSPGTATVAGGATQSFSATVAGTGGAPSQVVTWSITSGSGGSISAAGLFTAPAATGSNQAFTVRALAVDGTTAGTATITVPLSATAEDANMVNRRFSGPQFSLINNPTRRKLKKGERADPVTGGDVNKTLGEMDGAMMRRGLFGGNR